MCVCVCVVEFDLFVMVLFSLNLSVTYVCLDYLRYIKSRIIIIVNYSSYPISHYVKSASI